MTPAPSPRIVIDTNILVPALVGASAKPPGESASAGLIRGWQAGLCSVVISEELLSECEDVLQRPAFGLSSKRARRLCAHLGERALLVVPRRGPVLLRNDPDDDLVLKTALAGKAEMLVTDNRRDFAELATLRGGTPELRYRGVKVVGLSECLDEIRSRHAAAGKAMRQLRRWP